MKILLVYASFGEGHRRAASSLETFLNTSSYDILDFIPSRLKKIYSLSYGIITTKLPFFWQFIFYSSKNRIIRFVVNSINKFIFKDFLLFLEKNNPGILISTHFFVPPLITGIKNKLKLITIVTDLRVHPVWVNNNIDLYFAASEMTKTDLLNLGVDEKKVISGFVSLRDGFYDKLSEDSLRKKFSLDTRPCLLFVSSIRGRFPFLEDSINYLKDNFNFIIIYGKNKKLKDSLEKISNDVSLRCFPFYENIWELFTISSVIITKPGGLTVFEGIYFKKPFVFTHYIPGQEQGNMDILIKYGVAKFAKTSEEFVSSLNYFKGKYEEIHKQYPIEIHDIRIVLKEEIEKLMPCYKSY